MSDDAGPGTSCVADCPRRSRRHRPNRSSEASGHPNSSRGSPSNRKVLTPAKPTIVPVGRSMMGCLANGISAPRTSISSKRWLAACSSSTPAEKTMKSSAEEPRPSHLQPPGRAWCPSCCRLASGAAFGAAPRALHLLGWSHPLAPVQPREEAGDRPALPQRWHRAVGDGSAHGPGRAVATSRRGQRADGRPAGGRRCATSST